MLTRLEAIQDINMGRGIQLRFVGQDMGDGRTHTFNIIIRRGRGGKTATAHIECHTMRRTYTVHLTGKQLLAYIKLHYNRVAPGDSDLITLHRIAA